MFIFVNLRVPKICWPILGLIRRFQRTQESLVLWCDFWKIQKFFEILPVGDCRLFALNQIDFLAQCACGKALCKFEQPTSLSKNLGRWKNINFLKSSPRRAEGQILEETPCNSTSVCFTILTAWLVPIGSACQVWGQLVLYLLRNWLKQTAQEGAQEGEFYEVLWDCLNILFKEWGQIAAHYRNQCKFIVLLPKKTSVSALCSSPESGLTREKQYILEHRDTERLYCVEPSPSHLSTNQLLFPCTSANVSLCGWFWSRSCVSSVSASLWSFFQVNLKNPKKYLKNLWPVTGS